MKRSEQYMAGYNMGVKKAEFARQLSLFEHGQYLDTLSKNEDYRRGFGDGQDGFEPSPPPDDPTTLERVRDLWRDLTGS